MTFTLSTKTKTYSTFFFLNILRFLTLSSLIIGLTSQFILLINELKLRSLDLTDKTMGGDTSLDGTFYLGTNLITISGGVAGFAVSHTLSVIIIFLGLLSELPSPKAFEAKVQSFWLKAFPSFGSEHGKGVLGLLILLIGSFELGMNITSFPRVAAWFLFIHGVFNLILGITLGSNIHYLRSLSYLQSSSSSNSSNSIAGDLESQQQQYRSSPPSLKSFTLPINESFTHNNSHLEEVPASPRTLQLNLQKFKFTLPSFRSSSHSIRSESIYSSSPSTRTQSGGRGRQSNYQIQNDIYIPSNETNLNYPIHLTHGRNNGGGDGVSGYMSERSTSPISMQQAFFVRDLDQLERGRSSNHGRTGRY